MQTLNIQSVAKLKNDLLNEKNTTEKSENGQNITAEIWKKALNDILDPTSKMSEEDEKEYHNKILRKLRQGRRLTTAEKNYLQIHDPEMYKVALRVEMCRKRFTEQAKHCKSKEEFQTLVSNNMSVSDKDPMKEYIQAAISYEAQNIRKTPQYAALPDTNRKAEEKRTKGKKIKKIKIDEDKEKDNDKKTAPLPSENYGSDLKTLSAVLTIKPAFDNFSN